jgi:hypothetical protein
MAMITLNGIALSVLVPTGDRDELEIGEGLQRAFDGSALRSVRAYKRRWTMTTAIDTPIIARAFQKLLQGRQHRWSFNADLYSDLGLGPSASSGATSAPGGNFGSNALSLAATSGSISYAGLAGPSGVGGCTVMVQRAESGSWVDYALTWDATGALTNVYRQGIAQALAVPAWLVFTYSTGTVQLLNTAGTAQLFEELVVWPFEAPVGWLGQLYTWRLTNAWSFGLSLTLAGSIGSGQVTGKIGKIKLMPVTLNGNAYDAGESFALDLWEA